MTLELLNENEKGKKVKKLYIKSFEVDINNNNLNDIRKIIGLISWHNSFIELPDNLWKEKPLFITK